MDELAPPTGPAGAVAEDLHTGTSVATLQRAFLDHLCYQRGRHFAGATRSDHFLALAYPVRDGIPVLLENEARTLTDEELER